MVFHILTNVFWGRKIDFHLRGPGEILKRFPLYAYIKCCPLFLTLSFSILCLLKSSWSRYPILPHLEHFYHSQNLSVLWTNTKTILHSLRKITKVPKFYSVSWHQLQYKPFWHLIFSSHEIRPILFMHLNRVSVMFSVTVYFRNRKPDEKTGRKNWMSRSQFIKS